MSENLARALDPLPSAGRPRPGDRHRSADPGTESTPRPFPAVLGAAGAVCFLAAARWRTGRIATAAIGTVLLAQSGCFLHTTLRGKHRIWEHELDRLGLAGDEQLLDLGCGRGAVLIEAARRLPQVAPSGRTCGPTTRVATVPTPRSPTPRQPGSPIG